MRKSKQVRGARTVLEEDQPAFVDEHARHGKHFGDSRKVVDLPRVGAMAPDADPDERTAKRRRTRR